MTVALLDNLISALVGLAIVFLAGYGPARWLVPHMLRPWFWLCAPVIGLCVAAVGLGWLSIFLPVRVAAPALLVLAVLSTLGIRRASPIGPQAWREQAAVGVFAVIGLLVALVPLWGRPDLVSIGPNWDIEIYLPMAEYLKESATGFGLTEPAGFPLAGEPNPLLWRVNFFDPRWSGLAFAQLHAAAGVLSGQDAHEGLPGLLALMHVLSVPAAFLLFRGAFRLPAAPSLAASGLLAVNPAVLHVIFWSFGQQASSLPLLPWALATGAIALADPSRRSAILAGLALAALLAAFMPAALIYAVAMVLFAMLHVAQAPSPARTGALARPTFVAAAGIAAVSWALVPWAYLRGAWRARHFLGDQGVAGLTTGPDVVEFPPIGWAIGFFPSPEHGLLGFPESDAIALVARVLAVAAIGYGLVWAARTRNYLLLACGIGCAGLLLAMRYLAPYPYGYLKLMAGCAFVLLGLLVVGIWRLQRVRVPALVGVGLASAVSLVVLLPYTADKSRMEFRGLAGLEEAVPAGSSVLVSGHAGYQGPPSGAVAYFLRHAHLYGYLATGFSSFYRLRNDGVYDYGLFHDREAVPEELYGNADPIWQGSGLRLYRRPADAVYVRELGTPQPPIVERTPGQGSASGLRITEWTEEGYPLFQGWSPPGMGVLAETMRAEGRYPDISNREAYVLDVPVPSPLGTRPIAAGPRPQGVVTIGAFHAQEVTVTVNGEARPLSLQPGVGAYSLGPVDLPAAVEFRNAVEAPVYLKSVAVYRGQGQAAGLSRDAPLVRWNASQSGQAVRISLDYLGPHYRSAFDVYRSDGEHYGDWLLAASGDWSRQVVFEPAARQVSIGGHGIGLIAGTVEDGAYRAMLALWDGERLVRTITLFEFALENGRLREVKEGGKRVFIG